MVDRRRACCAKVRLVGDEVHVTLHPLSQGLAGLLLGSQNWGGLCAGIDFTTEDRRNEVGAPRKKRAVNRSDAVRYRASVPVTKQQAHGAGNKRINIRIIRRISRAFLHASMSQPPSRNQTSALRRG